MGLGLRHTFVTVETRHKRQEMGKFDVQKGPCDESRVRLRQMSTAVLLYAFLGTRWVFRRFVSVVALLMHRTAPTRKCDSRGGWPVDVECRSCRTAFSAHNSVLRLNVPLDGI